MIPHEAPSIQCSRRGFLTGVAAGLGFSKTALFAAGRRPKIAALTPLYVKYSHAEHIVDRFLEGYGWQGRYHRPAMDVVSLYTEQIGIGDLSHERASRHAQLRVYPTIAEALTLGGSKLAVDGVLLIGEHGEFPYNEKGQKLYPRYEYFQQIVDVYRRSGRTAPVFNDKHLSWNWEWAKEMYETAKEMGFGLMAGSSLPVAWRQPSRDLPWAAEVEEAVGVSSGSVESDDIHVIEAMQSIIERRRGGETGIRAVQALSGESFWKALNSGSWKAGGWDPRLLEAAFCRSNNLRTAPRSYNHTLPTNEDLRRLAPKSRAYRFEYNDGLKATIIQFQGGIVGERPAAARLKGGEIFSVGFHLPYYSMRNFFNPQVNHIETLFLTGKSPYPVERTLLTTGMIAAAIESLYQKGRKLETPHLAIRYQATRESTFWRK